MKRLRLATWSAVAGLTLVAGCQSSSTSCCDSGNGGFMSRLFRPRTSGTVIYDGPVSGMPGGMSYTAPIGTSPIPGGDCPCSSGGPMLGGQPFMAVPGGAYQPTLPPPYPGSAPPLAPVPAPNGSGLATPTPADPMARRG